MTCSAVASVSGRVFGWNLGSVSKKVMGKPVLYELHKAHSFA